MKKNIFKWEETMKGKMPLGLLVLASLLMFLAFHEGPSTSKTGRFISKDNQIVAPGGSNTINKFQAQRLGTIPLYFIPNKGQVHEKAKYYAKTPGYTLWLTEEAMIFDSAGNTAEARDVSSLVFVGANKGSRISAEGVTEHRVNYFKGNDKSKWKTGIATSKAVKYENLYKNIDLKVYGVETQVEYDWIVKPGGNPLNIRFQYKDIRGSRISEDGNVLIDIESGQLVHKKPVCFQYINGKRIEIAAEYMSRGNHTYSLRVGTYNKAVELIIDPLVLVYGSFLGGKSADTIADMTVDNQGNVYLIGTSTSGDFPLKNPFRGNGETFIVKLNIASDGSSSLKYSGYMSSAPGYDKGYGIAVDSSGMIYVAGTTTSNNFPLVHCYQCKINGWRDIFVAKFDTSLTTWRTLVFSTLLGGNGSDIAYDIDTDDNGIAYITGATNSTDFPVYGGYQMSALHYSDAFISKLDTNRSGQSVLLYSSYIGGNWTDEGHHIAVDDNENAYITGVTKGVNFPIRNGFQKTYGGKSNHTPDGDVFLTRIDTSRVWDDSLIYSTYIGGSEADVDGGIAIDNNGNAFITGYTLSDNFPLKNAYSRQLFMSQDAFITKVDTNASGASSLIYSTFLGGNGADEEGTGIAVDSSGNAYVTGHTDSSDFPVLNPYQQAPGGGIMDAFVTKLNASGNGLLFSTYLGGNHYDYSSGIALDDEEDIYIAGNTRSSVFPVTSGGYQQLMSGDLDCYIVKLSDTDTVPPGTPRLSLDRDRLNFGATTGLMVSDEQCISVNNCGGGTLSWAACGNQPWMICSPDCGTNSGLLKVSVDPSGLPAGTYTGEISVSDPGAENSPCNITVTLNVYNSGYTVSPFGSFDSPKDGSVVMSSIPVTGWALDDIGVTSVKIYLAQGNNHTYIGDAVFVEGARPDVEQSYNAYPQSFKAGWGYMLLTNFLPNKGNGSYTLLAKATDEEGHETILGTHSIICDNEHAVKPFGAIDTPEQGGIASGKYYVNFGWVLTPLPNEIPTDGSTIKVWVDGIDLGHPVYNQYRKDIATLFPDYINSNGAVGFFYLDTTTYSNGIHTIQWTARDSAGNSDGIGSRYFVIQNNTTTSDSLNTNKSMMSPENLRDIMGIPPDIVTPIGVGTGFYESNDTGTGHELEWKYPSSDGWITVKTEELNRVELQFGEVRKIRGWMQIGDQLRHLPTGSQVNEKTGSFSWGLGPAFVGQYHLVFLLEDRDGNQIKKNVLMDIKSKF